MNRSHGVSSTHSKTKEIVVIGLMVSLSFLLMFLGVPIIAVAPWLKIELSFLPIIILALGLNVKSALIASFLVNLLDYLLKGSLTGLPIDQLANFIATCIFLGVIYYLGKRTNNYIALFIAVAINTLMMCVLNYFIITPWYFSILGYELPSDLLGYVVSVYGTFNIIKWGLVALVYQLFNPYIHIFKQKLQQITR